MNKMVNPYMVGELSREVAAEALRHQEFINRSKRAFAEMKKEIRRELGCTRHNPEGASGRLHIAETLDTNSLLLLYRGGFIDAIQAKRNHINDNYICDDIFHSNVNLLFPLY